MKKVTLYLVCVFVVVFFNLKISYAQSAGEDLLTCMTHTGEFLYSASGDLSDVEAHCKFRNTAKGSEAHESFLKSLHWTREKVAEFPVEEQNLCHQQWNADWDQVRTMVFSRVDGLEYFNDGIREIPEDATPLERAVTERSFIDQAMTHLTGEYFKDKGSVQYDGSTCHWLIFNMSMARADNVAFVESESVKKSYLSRELRPHAYRPLWFMLQHADLYYQFQQDWLATLQETYVEYGFTERLVESLTARVEHNKQYQE